MFDLCGSPRSGDSRAGSREWVLNDPQLLELEGGKLISHVAKPRPLYRVLQTRPADNGKAHG
jgi:hypothetical protein